MATSGLKAAVEAWRDRRALAGRALVGADRVHPQLNLSFTKTYGDEAVDW